MLVTASYIAGVHGHIATDDQSAIEHKVFDHGASNDGTATGAVGYATIVRVTGGLYDADADLIGHDVIAIVQHYHLSGSTEHVQSAKQLKRSDVAFYNHKVFAFGLFGIDQGCLYHMAFA